MKFLTWLFRRKSAQPASQQTTKATVDYQITNRKLLEDTPLSWLDGMLGNASPYMRRKICWRMVTHQQPGEPRKASLPKEIAQADLEEVLDIVSEALNLLDQAKHRLHDLARDLPSDHAPSDVLGLVDYFVSQAETGSSRAELFALLLSKSDLEPADRELLQRALQSIETRMMEYVLPVTEREPNFIPIREQKAHLAAAGTNPNRAPDISVKVEVEATIRSLVLRHALSEGCDLATAEEDETARWR